MTAPGISERLGSPARKEDYCLVENSLEFGDIIVMVDERGNIFHAVSFLADVSSRMHVSPYGVRNVPSEAIPIETMRARSAP